MEARALGIILDVRAGYHPLQRHVPHSAPPKPRRSTSATRQANENNRDCQEARGCEDNPRYPRHCGTRSTNIARSASR